MQQYLLSTYTSKEGPSGPPSDPEAMQAFMERVVALEEEMDAAGAFVFGGALTGPDAASVVDARDAMVTDGPFAESKELIAGFYIIEAENGESASAWARKVSEAIDRRVEVRPFAAAGRVKDMMPSS